MHAIGALQHRSPSTLHELIVGFGPPLLGPAHDVLAEFGNRHGNRRVLATQLDDDALLDGVRGGRIDVALSAQTPDARDLETERICCASMVVLMAADHELAARACLSVDEIAGETFTGWHPEVSSEWADLCWLRARRGARPWRPRVALEAPRSAAEACSLVASGRAITVVPTWLAGRCKSEGVVSIPLHDDDPLTVSVVRRCDDVRAIVRAFVHCARRAAGAHGAPTGGPLVAVG